MIELLDVGRRILYKENFFKEHNIADVDKVEGVIYKVNAEITAESRRVVYCVDVEMGGVSFKLPVAEEDVLSMCVDFKLVDPKDVPLVKIF